MTATSPITQDHVDVVDGTLYIRDLVETDAEVLRVVATTDDAVENTRQCLRIGARAILAVNATVDTHIVEKRFDAMSDQIDEQLDAAVARIAAATESLVAEDDGRARRRVLDAHRDGLDELLGDTFDPDSKRSVIAIFEQVIEDAQEPQVEGIRRLVATDDEDGPLGRLRHEITRHTNECTRELRQEVQALSERIAVKEAVAPVIAITTGKGFTYEDVVHEAVGRIASHHGDCAEQTGKTSGSAATQKGDEVVTLDADDTYGFEGRFVLEAKARKLNMRKTCEELDAALENRDALGRDRGVQRPGRGADVGAVPPHRQQGDRRVRRRGRRRLRAAARLHVGPVGRAARAGRLGRGRRRPRAHRRADRGRPRGRSTG